MSHRIEQLSDDVILHLADCRDVLPTLAPVDLVLTDPPYGIGEDGGERNRYAPGRTRQPAPKHERLGWDFERPQADVIKSLLDMSQECFFFGGNYIADFLPPSMGWLYWDKQMGGDFSDGELIYTTRRAALRAVSIPKFGFELRAGKDRQHPTQKPVEVMRWCLGFCPDAKTVLDPFCGSGSTGVACVQLGRSFVGVERESTYFDIACRRISDELKRPRLDLGEPAAKPVQEAMQL